MKQNFKLALAGLLAAIALPALADVTIGVTVSATGPGAALGAAQKNTTVLLPQNIAGQKINWVVLDDVTDPTNASKNASKLIAEHKADAIVGSSTTANTAAIVDAAVEAKLPLLALAPIELPPAKDHWVFKLPQNNSVMGRALVEHMTANKVKTLGVVAFADVYGDLWLNALGPLLEGTGIKLVATERYNRTDTAVAGQVIKLLAARPDAVLVVGGGTPAALPHVTLVERGYKGAIYQTHGAPSSAFLKVGGKNVEGGVFVAGPMLAWEQLSDSSPTKKAIAQYVRQYEEKFGAGSVSMFGGYMWDAWAQLERAIPVALKRAQPGTPAFRAALRDAIESGKDVIGVHGVYNLSPSDHFGHDDRSRVLLRVENGAFKLINAR